MNRNSWVLQEAHRVAVLMADVEEGRGIDYIDYIETAEGEGRTLPDRIGRVSVDLVPYR